MYIHCQNEVWRWNLCIGSAPVFKWKWKLVASLWVIVHGMVNQYPVSSVWKFGNCLHVSCRYLHLGSLFNSIRFSCLSSCFLRFSYLWSVVGHTRFSYCIKWSLSTTVSLLGDCLIHEAVTLHCSLHILRCLERESNDSEE